MNPPREFIEFILGNDDFVKAYHMEIMSDAFSPRVSPDTFEQVMEMLGRYGRNTTLYDPEYIVHRAVSLHFDWRIDNRAKGRSIQSHFPYVYCTLFFQFFSKLTTLPF